MVTEWPFWCVQIEGEYTHKTPTQPYLTNSTSAQAQTHKRTSSNTQAHTHPSLSHQHCLYQSSVLYLTPNTTLDFVNPFKLQVRQSWQRLKIQFFRQKNINHCIVEYLIAPHVWWSLETANEFRFWWSRGVRPHWPRSLTVTQLLSLGSWRMGRPLVGSGLLQLLPSAGALPHLPHLALHSHYTGRNFGPNQFCLSPSLIDFDVILGPLILSPAHFSLTTYSQINISRSREGFTFHGRPHISLLHMMLLMWWVNISLMPFLVAATMQWKMVTSGIFS